eukprot:6215309-Amphidinium_carterae.1
MLCGHKLPNSWRCVVSANALVLQIVFLRPKQMAKCTAAYMLACSKQARCAADLSLQTRSLTLLSCAHGALICCSLISVSGWSNVLNVAIASLIQLCHSAHTVVVTQARFDDAIAFA